jgi:Uma2 family endonuclease
MTTTLRPSPPSKRSPRSPEQPPPHIVLENVSWETYESLLADLEHSHVFLTYDNGTLELMSPLPEHEWEGKLLARMLEVYTLLRKIHIASFGRATWRSRPLAKGLEADECYYVRNEPLVRGRGKIRLPKDPPPDLAIEVDVTHHTIDKRKIYASLKVGELWNWEDERLRVFKLGPRGEYRQVSVSPNLPDLPLSEVERFMRMRHGMSETDLLGLSSEWVQEQHRPG